MLSRVALAPRASLVDAVTPWAVVTVLQTPHRTGVVWRRTLPGPVTVRPTARNVACMQMLAIEVHGAPLTLGDAPLTPGTELPGVAARLLPMHHYMPLETAAGIMEDAPTGGRLIGAGVVQYALAPTWELGVPWSDPILVAWWRRDGAPGSRVEPPAPARLVI
jgi:hypothetical protein